MALATLTLVPNVAQLNNPGVMVPPISSSVTAASVSTGMQTLGNACEFISGTFWNGTGSFSIPNSGTFGSNVTIGGTFTSNGEAIFNGGTNQFFGNVTLEPGYTMAITAGSDILFVASSSMQLDNAVEMKALIGSTIDVSGTLNMQNPAMLNINAGAGLLINPGAGAAVRSGANIYVNTGGAFGVQSGGYLNFPGATTTVTDNVNPSYASPQSITKVQPLIIVSASPNNGLTCQLLNDAVGSGNIYDCVCNNYINGSTISSMVITILTSFTAPTSNDATAVLYRCDNSATPITLTALASKTIPTGLSNLTYYRYVINLGTPEVTDQSKYTYFIRFTASSTESLSWASPMLNLTGISQLGMF